MSPLNQKNEPPIGRRNHEKCTCIGFFTVDAQTNKNEPLAMFRKNELNICSYKYKNRLIKTQTKEEILIFSLWHLLEVVFHFSEVVKYNTARASPSQLGTKLKDAVVWYVPKKDPYRSAQRATTNYSKIAQTNCISQKLSTTARVNTVLVGTKLQYVILWDIPKKHPSRPEQMACTNYSKNGQRNCGYENLSK